jgi:molybdopterin molybdotransferase
MSEMITFEKAFEIVMGHVRLTDVESISFSQSAGRILAEDILCDMEMPPFNRSAVDGYACHRVDLNNPLEVLEVIPAGKEPSMPVGKNQCSKIMTGAIVPEGCDIVIMIEDVKITDSGKIEFAGNNPKTNISFKGEDAKPGDLLLKPGKLIKPQDIAVMASVGHIVVKVLKRPLVGIISTGDELVEPDNIPAISQIRNSNAYQLMAQVERAGGECKYFGIAPDNEDLTFRLIEKAISESDIVLLTGGVSMGDFDFVPEV